MLEHYFEAATVVHGVKIKSTGVSTVAPYFCRRCNRSGWTCKLGSCIIHNDDKFWFCKLLKTCEVNRDACTNAHRKQKKVIILLLRKTVTYGDNLFDYVNKKYLCMCIG